MNERDIKNKIHELYWEQDVNCATATLKLLSENYGAKLNSQSIHAAIGMHGAGGYRAQCGLVEGTLVFIGIYGTMIGIEPEKIAGLCCEFAKSFENRFASLICKDLRAEGFHESNPPHLCEDLTNKAVIYSINFLNNRFNNT